MSSSDGTIGRSAVRRSPLLDRGDEDRLADARLLAWQAGRASRQVSPASRRRVDRRRQRRGRAGLPRPVPRRPRSAARGRRRWRPCRRRSRRQAASTVPDADEPAGREDPDPVADALDLVSRWLESRIARPRSWTSRRSRSRISTTPSGSIDGRRLVEDQEVGRLDQRVGDAEALAHAARVGLDRGRRPGGQPDLVEDLVDGGLAPRRGGGR